VKNVVAAIVALVAGLFAANMLGVAVAEAPTSTSTTTTSTTSPPPTTLPRTISVTGVATKPIGQFDNASEATAVYREGMAEAVVDGQSKASFLAEKVGATLGAVQGVVEGGGSIGCTGSVGEESSYPEYQGERPDFGDATSAAPAAAVAPEAAHVLAKHTAKPKAPKRKRKHAKAKKATAASCKLSAQVSLVYAIS
jgi:hypothetical protein